MAYGRSGGNTAFKQQSGGAAANTGGSPFKRITGFWKSESGKTIGVNITQEILDALASNAVVGGRLVLFEEDINDPKNKTKKVMTLCATLPSAE